MMTMLFELSKQLWPEGRRKIIIALTTRVSFDIMVIMAVHSKKTLWAFPESCNANKSCNKHLNNGSCLEEKSANNSTNKVIFFCANSVGVFELGCRKVMLGTGLAISFLLCTNGLRNGFLAL